MCTKEMPASTQPQKQRFDGYQALPAYDALINAPGATMPLGLAAGIERTNNVDQLKNGNYNRATRTVRDRFIPVV
jgi:hypothetical protein